MIAATDLLTPSQLAKVRARSDWYGLFLVAHAWAIIFGAMALFVWWPNPLTFLLGVVLIGGRQLGLAVLMHDGAHGILCKNPKLNMWVSQWLCAYPVLAETMSYRRYHLQHHMHTQQPEDPDLILSKPFPITKSSFRRKAIRDLTGQTGFQQRKAQILNAMGDSSWPISRRVQHFSKKLGRPMITQLVLLGGLTAVGHWYLYFALWLLPFLTWHQFITRVRNIAEHAVIPDNDDPFRNARTTLAGPLMRLVLAPYFVNYHVEHHLMMWVPCYRLPEARRYLLENGYGPRMESKDSYFDVISLATSRPANEDKPGTVIHNARRRRVAGIVSEGFEAADDSDNANAA